MIKLGALWRKTSKDGGIYLSGSINESTRVIVLPARERKSDKSPDYYLFLDENKPMDERPRQRSSVETLAEVKKVMSYGGTVQPEPKAQQPELKKIADQPHFMDESDLPF